MTAVKYSPAIFRSPETSSYRQSIRKTLETFHFQSTRTDPHTRRQSRRTILPCCQTHTTTRTSAHPHCQATSSPPTPSDCFQIIRQTDSRRNNTGAHGEHTLDRRIPTIHGQPPVPGRTGVHSPHYSLHNSGSPILCIRCRNCIPTGSASACPDPEDWCILPAGHSLHNSGFLL